MRIIVQARTNSSRLPGKALLPIRGWPVAVLAALRAARSGFDVTIATTTDPSDDALAGFSASTGLHVVRGSVDDVFQRFIEATADLSDSDIAIRLTGDNLLPDADFCARLAEDLDASESDLVGTRWPESGLPYGLAGEAFRVSALRAGARTTLSNYEKEHVTPWIWRNRPTRVFSGLLKGHELANRRCTIDNFTDFARIRDLFDRVEDPISEPWHALVERLRMLADADTGSVTRRSRANPSSSRFVLGTAQLGMKYGTWHQTELPSDKDAEDVVLQALELGVNCIDTARAYSLSEQRIGAALARVGASHDVTVVTKLDPLSSVPENAPEWAVRAAVEASIYASCRALRLQTLPVLLLHRSSHVEAWHGAAWRSLLDLRSQGVITRLGASVQNTEQAAAVIANRDIEYLQLPFNLLDWRWQRDGIPDLLEDRADIIVHARSVFLQGVLLNSSGNWPAVEHKAAKEIIAWLEGGTKQLGRESIADLCVAFARSQNWIDGLVIGTENETQLRDNISLFTNPEISPEHIANLLDSRRQVSESLLDPSKW